MTVSVSVLSFIPDVADRHVDELAFLWEQRRASMRSPRYREREVALLEERIQAHMDGVLLNRERVATSAGSGQLEQLEDLAFAFTWALVSLGTIAARAEVTNAFRCATFPALLGLRDALAHGPAAPLLPQLTETFLTAAPHTAAAAGEVLAFHNAIAPTPQQLERLIRAEDPFARAAAWRLVSYCAVVVPPDWYQIALGDDDPSVKHAALHAAAWTASPVFVPYCRSLAAKPSPESLDALTLYAAIAPPEDYQLVGAVAANPAAGPERFRVIGSFAHPYFIELLINEMSNADPAAAVAAGAAFFKMTGRDVESNTRVKIPLDGKPPADEFEAEFQDEVFLPDPELARKAWQELAPTLAHSPRICRGMDVSQPLPREQFALLDMESRYEYCLRARLFSGWQGTPLVLERYPQRF